MYVYAEPVNSGARCIFKWGSAGEIKCCRVGASPILRMRKVDAGHWECGQGRGEAADRRRVSLLSLHIGDSGHRKWLSEF